MEITTNLIGITDILDLTEMLAMLNLGYLGISVTIMALVGAAFYFFSIKPLKDTIDQQKQTLENLKKEVKSTSIESQKKFERDLQSFEEKQTEETTSLVKQKNDLLASSIKAQIAIFEKEVSEKIDSVTEKKDDELKVIILSEIDNRLRVLEKSLNTEINKTKDVLNKQILSQKETLESLNKITKKLKRRIKELEVYRYSKEGQMGAIYGLIELLKESIDEKIDWRITKNLEALEKEIKGIILVGDVITRIEEQLCRIEEKKYNLLIEGVRSQYRRKEEK